jgi:hypothetical protein
VIAKVQPENPTTRKRNFRLPLPNCHGWLALLGPSKKKKPEEWQREKGDKKKKISYAACSVLSTPRRSTPIGSLLAGFTLLLIIYYLFYLCGGFLEIKN